MPVAAERPKEPVAVGKLAQEVLRGFDFPFRRVRSAVLTERDRVRHRVIADPMPGVVRPFGLTAKLRLPQFFADDEETRFHPVARQDLQNAWRDLRMRAIVEGESDAAHFVFLTSTARIGSRPCDAWGCGRLSTKIYFLAT